jgi:hypothetical protein
MRRSVKFVPEFAGSVPPKIVPGVVAAEVAPAPAPPATVTIDPGAVVAGLYQGAAAANPTFMGYIILDDKGYLPVVSGFPSAAYMYGYPFNFIPPVTLPTITVR